MNILFDTSVLVAGLVQTHPKHHLAFPWLVKVVEQEINCYIAAHSLDETYAVLTTLPVSPRILPHVALNLIESNLKKHAHIVFLTTQDYWTLLTHLSAQSLVGGIVYDGLLYQAAKKAKVDKILTFNQKDFKRFDDASPMLLSP